MLHPRPSWSPPVFPPLLLAVLATSILTVTYSPLLAAAPGEIEFFEQKIRPVLVQHCYECHSADADEAAGGMLLDSRAAMLKGGESGPTVVPKDISNSLLIDALEYNGLEMPPAGKLPEETIAHFRKWIEMGAPDPRTAAVEAPGSNKPVAVTADELWSLAPVRVAPPAEIRRADWPAGTIDRYLLSRLETSGLQPVTDADPETLVRRLYFDLVGLPPEPEVVTAFAADPSPSAYRALIEQLLASPAFGERWGRHWLDVARYAESNGKSRDVLMPQAWRYRDWVIDALNADMPYDRFITEQIAGDLLPADDAGERDRLQIATGLLAVGSKTLTGGTFQMDLIDEQIDVVSKAVLALTVSCARCHDHKFDPIPTRDYYAMAGIFLSTDTRFGGGLRRAKDQAGQIDQLLVLGAEAEEQAKSIKDRAQQIADLQKQVAAAKKQITQLGKKNRNAKQEPQTSNQPPVSNTPAQDEKKKQGETEGDTKSAPNPKDDANPLAIAKAQLAQLEQQLKSLQEQPAPQLELAVGVREAGKPQDCKIRIRGEIGRQGDLVSRGFLSCVSVAETAPIEASASGRLELANWLTQPDHPLTPRVAANRVWQHLFGRGLVGTVDNFGSNAERPSHPELLDYLAAQLVGEHAWSVKSLIREVVLSRAYQMSSDYHEANLAIDPSNTLLWRMNRRRLEAEAIRDAVLAAAGQLQHDRPPASAVARMGDGEVGRGINTQELEQPFPHRSVYLPILRGIVPELLKTFDFPEPSNVQGQRDATNVPGQALFLMNNPLVIDASQAMARRVVDGSSDDVQRIETAWLLAYSRRPTQRESSRALAYLRQQLPDATDAADREEQLSAWSSLCHGLLASAEFRYLP